MIDILLENLDRLWRGETALKNHPGNKCREGSRITKNCTSPYQSISAHIDHHCFDVA